MRRRLPLAAVLACLLAGTSLAAPAPSKLNSVARHALQQLRQGASLSALQTRYAAINAQGELDVFITGDVTRAELEAAGAKVRTALPGVFTADLPLDAVDRVAALTRVRTVEGAVWAEPELDLSVPTTHAHTNRGAGPSFLGINGEGVIVGDVDSGIDYGHGDFDDFSGNTRIVNIWDQTVNGSPPSGFGYGTEWDSADIDADVSTERDLSGHGTHVMGIAAGDGSQTGGGFAAYRFAGMAPKADIIMVKTTFQTTAIIDGVDYIFGRAAALGQPAVVNLSLGSHFGPHDGTSAFEASLSALTGPGRILVKSAGNSGGDDVHAERIVGAGDTDATLLVAGSSFGRIMAINGYYNSTENLSLTIRTPNGTTIGPITRGNSMVQGTANGTVTVENGVSTTSKGDYEVYIEAEHIAGSMNGIWTIQFAAVATGATNGEIDLWTYFTTAGLIANWVLGNQPDDEVVSEPGNADSAITVGSWTTRQFWQDCNGFFLNFVGAVPVGRLTPFSSAGPTRDGRIKPDITAPGSAIGSATTFDIFQSCSPGGSLHLGDNLNHTINQGTSMSAPHVAGAVALLLQKHPLWTPSEIKAYLRDHALVDGFTGTVPNSVWGDGKLRLGDLLDPFVTVVAPNGTEVLLVGSEVKIEWLSSDNVGVTGVDICLSRDNGATYEDIATGIPNTGTYVWTVTPPANNSGSEPVFSSLVKIKARDAAGNTGDDESNEPFSIFDGPTPTRIALFDASSVDEGVEVRWQFVSDQSFGAVTLERGDAWAGPWTAVEAARWNDDGVQIAMDRSAQPGRTYYYRLVVDVEGERTTFGPIEASAGSTIREFALSFSHNPSHGPVDIEFAVPKASNVSIVLFDLQGRAVETVASGRFEPGRHAVAWDGRRAGGPGIYFVQLKAAGRSWMKRLAVIP